MANKAAVLLMESLWKFAFWLRGEGARAHADSQGENVLGSLNEAYNNCAV
jgi:hypothetical protein